MGEKPVFDSTMELNGVDGVMGSERCAKGSGRDLFLRWDSISRFFLRALVIIVGIESDSASDLHVAEVPAASLEVTSSTVSFGG